MITLEMMPPMMFGGLVLAMLIGDLYTDLKARGTTGPLLQKAVQAALHQVEGTYGIAVICKDEPDTLVVARKGSPLIIGVGQGPIATITSTAPDSTRCRRISRSECPASPAEFAMTNPARPASLSAE